MNKLNIYDGIVLLNDILPSLKFTVVMDNIKVLPYLDIFVTKNCTNKLKFDLFIKDTIYERFILNN